ncbi:MAG: ComEC/Rec2 family competence protein [Varibaculum cambriense]|uniref:ComEC/Rec2 family competence protein n=1 Tax=Varibaculum cambriense TaxID=184870 RepID=UPI00241D98D1|nr:ComEC/Rec2 family competence protein [Varibaculum cambriense]MBS6618895.1 ComEC/Rec2 family competence protein [Varibaculum cambriense]
MKGRILDLRLAPAAIIAWLGALVLPALPLQWLPLIAALTLGGAAVLLLVSYWKNLSRIILAGALALGALGGVALAISQSARVIAADPLARAWQGQIDRVQAIALVETPPRKYDPASEQQITQLRLLSARLPDTPAVNTGVKLVAFGQHLPKYPRGTVIETVLQLKKPSRGREPNARESSQNLTTVISANSLLEISGRIIASPKVRAGPRGAATLKEKFATRLEEKLVAADSPAAATLLPAMILGIRADASENTEALKTAGIVHITCVSGMHISVLLSLVALLSAGLKRRWRLLAGAGLLVGYCLLLGPSPSLLRAAVMGMVSLLALASGKEPYSFSALEIAIIGLLIFEPGFGSDTGFLLSVSATAAIVLAARPLEEKLHRAIATVKRQGSGRTPRLLSKKNSALFRKFLVAFLSVSAVSLVAQLACLPGQLLIRPGINILTVLANVAIAPVVTLLIWGGACLTFLPLPGTFLTKILGIGCNWVMTVARVVASNRFAILPWPAGAPGILALGIVVAGLTYIYRCYFPKRKINGNV